MKKRNALVLELLICICVFALVGCKASAVVEGTTKKPLPTETQVEQEQIDETSEQVEELTLKDLLGEDYIDLIAETITMNMENRMDKTPEVQYYPIVDQAPVTDYVTIDADLPFEINENGDVVITFAAGTLTDETHGEQRFILPRMYY